MTREWKDAYLQQPQLHLEVMMMMMVVVVVVVVMTMMIVRCPKAGSLAFTPPGDEMSVVVSHCLPHRQLWVELDRCIGNTHHRGRLWDNRNHWQMMTIGDQSVLM